jgi:hypothetical protein
LGVVAPAGDICLDVLENVIPFDKRVGIFDHKNPLVQVVRDFVTEDLCVGVVVNGDPSLFVHVNCVVVFDMRLVVYAFDRNSVPLVVGQLVQLNFRVAEQTLVSPGQNT